jgi:hypothetical protein
MAEAASNGSFLEVWLKRYSATHPNPFSSFDAVDSNASVDQFFLLTPGAVRARRKDLKAPLSVISATGKSPLFEGERVMRYREA